MHHRLMGDDGDDHDYDDETAWATRGITTTMRSNADL